MIRCNLILYFFPFQLIIDYWFYKEMSSYFLILLICLWWWWWRNAVQCRRIKFKVSHLQDVWVTIPPSLTIYFCGLGDRSLVSRVQANHAPKSIWNPLSHGPSRIFVLHWVALEHYQWDPGGPQLHQKGCVSLKMQRLSIMASTGM